MDSRWAKINPQRTSIQTHRLKWVIAARVLHCKHLQLRGRGGKGEGGEQEKVTISKQNESIIIISLVFPDNTSLKTNMEERRWQLNNWALSTPSIVKTPPSLHCPAPPPFPTREHTQPANCLILIQLPFTSVLSPLSLKPYDTNQPHPNSSNKS